MIKNGPNANIPSLNWDIDTIWNIFEAIINYARGIHVLIQKKFFLLSFWVTIK